MKKLIIITSSLYIRNYIETDAFKNILDEETFTICFNDISDKESVKKYPNFFGEFGISKVNVSLYHFITMLLMYSNRSLNKGFYFYFKIRNSAIYFPSLRLKKKAKKWCSNKLCRYILISTIEFFRPIKQPKKLLQYLSIVVINFFGLTSAVIKLYRNFVPVNQSLVEVINNIKPDLILIPNGGLDPIVADVISASCKTCRPRVMLLIDNWDNLCSKSKFAFNPDYLCVWGEQAQRHAIKYHDFDSSKVFLAGTPRYDVYYEYQNQEENLNDKYSGALGFPYILFAGCWPPFDEIGVLEILDGLVDKYKDFLPSGCKILYRPHPWGENYDKLDYLQSKNLENVKIDPQMSLKSRPDDYRRRSDFQPELDYYPFLLDQSEFVICPLASIIIEASIMNKKVLALAHDDNKSLLNPSMMYDNSDYFDRLSDMTNITLLRELYDLDSMFYKMIVSDMPVNQTSLSYYIVKSNKLYPGRIEDICKKLPLAESINSDIIP